MTEDDLYPLLARWPEGRFIPTLHRLAVTETFNFTAVGNLLDHN